MTATITTPYGGRVTGVITPDLVPNTENCPLKGTSTASPEARHTR